VYGEAATKAKGTATLAWIDCSTKEGKKVRRLVLDIIKNTCFHTSSSRCKMCPLTFEILHDKLNK